MRSQRKQSKRETRHLLNIVEQDHASMDEDKARLLLQHMKSRLKILHDILAGADLSPDQMEDFEARYDRNERAIKLVEARLEAIKKGGRGK